MSIVIIAGGLFSLALCVFYVLCFWKLFEKAGEPGWKCLIPIYNLIVWLKITKAGLWFIISIMTSIIFSIISVIQNDLAVIGSIIVMVVSNFILYRSMFKAYGKGIGYTILSLFFSFITVPIMAFGKSEYIYDKQIVNKKVNKSEVINASVEVNIPVNNSDPKPTKLPPRQPKIAPSVNNNTDTSTSFHTEQPSVEEKQDDFIIEDSDENQIENNLDDGFVNTSDQDDLLNIDNNDSNNEDNNDFDDEDIFIEPIE